MAEAIDYFGNGLNALANLGLLLIIWKAGNCSGISVKSRNLYALVFTTRLVYLLASFVPMGNTTLQIVLIFVTLTYITTVSAVLFFSKAPENEYDTARVGKLIVPCIVVVVLVHLRPAWPEMFWMFSVYLEAVAMVPQFHYTIKAKRIPKPVVCYLAAMIFYKGLCIRSWDFRDRSEDYWYEFAVAAGIVQFVLYGDFFLQILPWLYADKVNEQSTVATIESGDTKAGHLASNVATVALTPGSLTGFHNDKMNLLNEEAGKC